MKLLTRIRSLWTTRPPEEESRASRSRALGRDHHGRQRALGAAARPAGRRGSQGRHEGASAARSRPRSTSTSSRSPSTRSRRRTGRGPRDEIDTLMEIFGETIDREFPDLVRQGVSVRFIGRRDRAPGRAPAQDGEPRAADDREHAGSVSGSRSTTAGGPRSSRRRGSSSSPASSRGRSTRTSSPRTSTRPECPTPTSSSAPRASCASRTSCSGSSRTRSSCSSTRHWPDFSPRDLESALSAYARRRRRFGGR